MEEEIGQQALWDNCYFDCTVLIALMAIAFAVVAVVMLAKERRKTKELERQNEKLATRLEWSRKIASTKSRFVQSVSQEMRTPLNAIAGFSSLLTSPEMHISEDDHAEFCHTISKNASILNAIVDDMLSLSELQDNDLTAEIVPCSCNEMCRTAIYTAKAHLPKGVTLDFTTDVDDECTVNTDHKRMHQVLLNFLTNAEKHTTEGSITLDCSQTKMPGYVTFTVTDTGCGIANDKQETIRKRFADKGTFQHEIGLGLNICSLIANLLDARIGLDREYTSGARFYFAIAK